MPYKDKEKRKELYEQNRSKYEENRKRKADRDKLEDCIVATFVCDVFRIVSNRVTREWVICGNKCVAEVSIKDFKRIVLETKWLMENIDKFGDIEDQAMAYSYYQEHKNDDVKLMDLVEEIAIGFYDEYPVLNEEYEMLDISSAQRWLIDLPTYRSSLAS